MTRSLLEDEDGWKTNSSSVVLNPKVKKRTVDDEKNRWDLTRLSSQPKLLGIEPCEKKSKYPLEQKAKWLSESESPGTGTTGTEVKKVP
jgi:hypothetical protein